MKIVLLTIGTRGDVQPFVALACGLRESGHDVTIATGNDHAPLVREQGLLHAPLRANFHALLETPEGKKALSGHPLRALHTLKAVMMPLFREVLDDCWAAARDADAIICHPKALGGPSVAERLGVPCFIGATVPVLTPTREFAAPGVTGGNLGGLLNRMSYSLVRLAPLPFRETLNRWRKQVLNLPPLPLTASGYEAGGESPPILYAYSPHLLPPPSDWPTSATVTGYWFLEGGVNWQPPAELVRFLDAGPPPVYVGFGSMTSEHPERLARLVISALERAGQRGVLATGWGGIARAACPDTVFILGAAPHEWLLPRMAAAIHHGGAGTVGAGLRAGKPTLVCPV
ncbi:MAG TPA: glycosyltransferase, partial [Armatimonadota bacterium]|nr:glycosyltransferase [Armatimonadota bacterium]